jgi:hypothetical protein
MSSPPAVSTPAPLAPAVAVYGERAARHRAERDRLSARSRRFSTARLALAVAAAGFGAWWLAGAALAGVLGLGALAALALVVVRHERVERFVAWSDLLACINDDAAARATRRWATLPPPVPVDVPASHPYAADLDLFGHASVFEWLGPPGTPQGRDALARALMHPAAANDIRDRQEAVRELAPLLDFRQALHGHARLADRIDRHEIGFFLEWAVSPSWLLRKPWLVWLSRLVPLVTLSLLAAHGWGAVAAPYWLVPGLASLAMGWSVQRWLAPAIHRAGSWEPAIRGYAGLLTVIGESPLTSARGRALQARLGRGDAAPDRALGRLRRLVSLGDLRLQPLLHLPVEALTMWDWHVWYSLDRWRETHGRHVRDWLAVAGELEALAALAGPAYDHPEWTAPEVDPAGQRFEARGLGHPLIADAARVVNDVTVGPPGTILFVTGSNMSGKSTLLRAIGVNVVLAQAGGPVCASSLRMPPLAPHTSFRVSDSLEAGVSYFMASLTRLQALVDAARSAGDAPSHPRVLYLLDEILQGTNSAEREMAVRIVMDHLLATDAIGAITTHDLALTDSPEARRGARHVHFAEQVIDRDGRSEMHFDFRVREGVATSRNALRLMHMVGLAPREGFAGAPVADR